MKLGLYSQNVSILLITISSDINKPGVIDEVCGRIVQTSARQKLLITSLVLIGKDSIPMCKEIVLLCSKLLKIDVL